MVEASRAGPDHAPDAHAEVDASAVLREVEGGESLRVTVRGRPVADLVPIGTRRRSLSPGDVPRIVARAPLDPGFAGELDAAAGATIDEL